MDTPVSYRRFDDIDGQRDDVYQLAKAAIGQMRPFTNATHQLEVADVDYDDDFNPTLAEEKEAIMKRKSLQRKLLGTVRLKDAAGTVIEEQRMTLANVPHVNSRGMFIRDGVPYVVRNQLRLRPGVYTRKQKNGGLESHFNVNPGTGRGFRIDMEPETGLFKMRVGQSTTRLYPVLRAMGVQDDDMRQVWGEELFNKNYREKSGRDELDLHKLVRKFGDVDADLPAEQLPKALLDQISRAEVDEDTTELTLGQRIKNLSPAVLLQATKKQLRIAQGLDKSDNRDSQAYQSFHAAQDLIAERLRRDMTGAGRKSFWKASKYGSLKNLPPGFLDDNVSSLFQGSGLAQGVDDVNPVEIADLRQAITRLGEGGISNESVSREARNVQASYLGVIDANRAPDSSNIGTDLRLTDTAERGSDNQLYTTVRNLKTGQLEKLSARTLSTKSVTFPGEMATEVKRVPVIRGDHFVYVPKADVEYEVVNPEDMMSRASRLIPFPEGVKGKRLAMGSRMTAQAVPLTEPEAPFVQSGNSDGTSLHQSMGRDLGAKFAPAEGIVTKVTPDAIELTGNDGQKHTVQLYNHYPMSRKTYLHNEAVVEPGTLVSEGQPLARSNYTDKTGAFALGRNMRVGYMVAEGDTIEDAFVISESAAKKLGAQAMYKTDLDLDGLHSTDKASYNALYAGKYTPTQLDTIDDDGVIRVGTEVQTGDPLVLAVGKKDPAAIGALVKSPKSAVSDKAQVWEHKAPGVVTDVQRTKHGVRVLVKSYDVANIGDKLAGRYGNKGVISGAIRPDDQMPIAEDGKPLEAIMNATGVVSRVNPSALAESLLGKIVERTGRAPYVIKSFGTPEGIADFALNEAAKHGINELETVTDPRDGRKIPNVFVGNSYLMRLHHKAEGKISARDQGSYTIDEYPARGGDEGAKRISLLDTGVLIAAGATEFLKDAKLARGQRNDDYWRQVRHGETPMLPSGSFADEQFKTMLKAAGVNIRSEGTKEHLRPLLDTDVERMAPYEVENSETFDFDTMAPIKGGLFDVGMTGGAGGNRFTKITLPVKVPHPLFLEPIHKLLGKSGKELDAILAGKEEINGLTGPAAVEKALSEIDIDREMELSKQTIRTGAMSKRDAAVRRLHYLAGLKKMGVAPQELMVSKIAVIPPRYRPVVRGKNTDMIHDLNYLYKDLLEAKKNYEEANKTFGEAGDEYVTLMKAVSAVSGIEGPVNPKTAEQGVKGILRYAIGLGDSPKHSAYQRKVIGTSVDTVGRSVITADRHMGLDDVGVPEEMAWKIFRPYIIRRLVTNGTPPAEAIKAVEDRTPAASAFLDDEMEVRPVVYNRAPALHRYAYQGAWGKRVPGDAIHMPYQTLKAIGGDYDGDAINIHVPSSAEAIEDVKEKLMPSKNLFFAGNFETHYEPTQDYTMGLYLAGKLDPKQKTVTFANAKEAKAAYAKGLINARTPIRILA
jgi:DNA-directed RNA polymerase beta subunit